MNERAKPSESVADILKTEALILFMAAAVFLFFRVLL